MTTPTQLTLYRIAVLMQALAILSLTFQNRSLLKRVREQTEFARKMIADYDGILVKLRTLDENTKLAERAVTNAFEALKGNQK